MQKKETYTVKDIVELAHRGQSAKMQDAVRSVLTTKIVNRLNSYRKEFSKNLFNKPE